MYPGAGSARQAAFGAELQRALEEQARELNVISCRLGDATQRMPTGPGRHWRGLAQLNYAAALIRLRNELHTAHQLVTQAAQQSSRAAQSVGGRVG